MRTRKRLISSVLKCGTGRVWIDPKSDKINHIITRSDVKGFVADGLIKKRLAKKKSALPEKRQQRRGSMKGRAGARIGKKNAWLKIIRPQRKMLRQLREENKLQESSYRKLYLMIKGGSFRSKNHMMSVIKERGLVKE